MRSTTRAALIIAMLCAIPLPFVLIAGHANQRFLDSSYIGLYPNNPLVIFTHHIFLVALALAVGLIVSLIVAAFLPSHRSPKNN